MADCGATGSALDRTAARIISSTLGHQNAAQSHAGKAISSFLGGVATTGTGATFNGNGNVQLHGAGSLMPSALPTAMPLHMNMNMNANHGHGIMVNQTDHNSIHAHAAQQHQQQMEHTNMNMNQPSFNRTMPMPMPMPMGGQMNSMMHPHPHPQAQMQHANMQMQMQMNMMQQQQQQQQQQMAMMQMAKQQQHQQQQQQHHQMKQQQLEQQTQSQSQSQQLNPETQQAQEQAQPSTADAEVDNDNANVDEWHNDLEHEFQSYLNSYKNDIDAASTDDGNVQGASIEQLAAAWEEAEKQFSQDDYANLAQGYDSIGEDGEAGVELGRPPQHEHYEFGPESEQYGRSARARGDTEQDPFIDLMSEGMKHFQEGDTSEAILCFESELRNVDGNSADAWLMLGKCHAENDQDRNAITCLENAVERDPYSAEALLALGVSYVNELDHRRAFKYLNNWVTHNPNYAGLETMKSTDATDATDDTAADTNGGDEGALYQLKSLLNQAKDYDELNGNVENSVDVLEALGVVCNVTREFEEGAEYFRTATRLRPDDYQLFNKLGATLANSSRSNEAQDAYQRALAIKPKYARAWLNMAISHSNLQNHDEAARCYLQALSLNPGAVHVWSYLRIALTCSEKWDLLPLAASQDLNAFQGHFDFV